MNKISNVSITDCNDSVYIRPARMLYDQDGRKKVWDLMKVHDSVSVVLFNVTRQVLIFVKQFRPAVYYAQVDPEDCGKQIDTQKYPADLGMTVELCAGIVDKDQSLVKTAQDEILEECGYNVPLSCIQKVTSYRSGVGVTGSLQTLYYAEVTDNMKVSEGGGNSQEGEYIEVIEVDIPGAHKMMFDENIARPVSFMFALMWFFSKEAPKYVAQKL